jgi:diphthine-ammonia ligase
MIRKLDCVEIENSFINMPKGEPFICSFSGGKDSMIALSMACEKGELRGLIHWVDDDSKESAFHFQDLSIIKEQAKCMDIPLTITYDLPWRNRLELLKTYQKFAQQGIKSIVFGDIYVEDSVKLQSILCKKAGLIPRYPIWGKSHSQLIEEICNRRIKPIITRINTSMLSKEWLGKTFDKNVYDALCSLGINPFGENGEFHTTVVEANIFKKDMAYSLIMNETRDNCVNINMTTHNRPHKVFKLID